MTKSLEPRLDLVLIDRGLASTRTEAQRLIKSGRVIVDYEIVTKSNRRTSSSSHIALVESDRESFVSRAGEKLAEALDKFQIDPIDKNCLDIGIPTGGFTDCLLRRGARFVVGVNVGHGQLHASLKDHTQIELREGVNARNLDSEDFPFPFSLITVDVSFISLTNILPGLTNLLTSNGIIVCLIKPQFEVGYGNLGKNGIVTDAVLREKARDTVHSCAIVNGLIVANSIDSPISGGDGNVEFLSEFVKQH